MIMKVMVERDEVISTFYPLPSLKSAFALPSLGDPT